MVVGDDSQPGQSGELEVFGADDEGFTEGRVAEKAADVRQILLPSEIDKGLGMDEKTHSITYILHNVLR